MKNQLEGKGKGGRRSRRRRNADGTEVDGDDEGNQDDEEMYLKEQQDKLNEEKRTIQQKKNLNGLFHRNDSYSIERIFLDKERQTMLHELEEQKHEIEREQEERRKMQHKIQEMESKLIKGGKDIVTHTSEQEQILRQKRYDDFLDHSLINLYS